MVELSLHLGAHKTGTTFIQDSLCANKELLERHGVVFLPLESMRESITAAVSSQAPPVSLAAKNMICELMRSARTRVVFSDENLLGYPGHRQGRAGLYPNAKRLLSNLKALGLPDEFTVLLCIRSYDTYLVSLYSEILRNGPILTFGEFLLGYELRSLSWFELLKDIRSVFQKASIKFWTFETFKERPILGIAAVAGLPESIIGVQSLPSRQSMSEKAVAELLALRDSMSEAEILQRVPDIEAAFPRSAAYPAFHPLSKVDEQCLRDEYWDDLRRIRLTFPEAFI
jgi:hypothetical protein